MIFNLEKKNSVSYRGVQIFFLAGCKHIPPGLQFKNCTDADEEALKTAALLGKNKESPKILIFTLMIILMCYRLSK